MLEKLTCKFQDALKLVSGKSTITEKNINDAVEAVKIALLEADVNLRVVRRFVNSTIEEARGEKVLRSVNPGDQFIKLVHDKLTALLGGEEDKSGALTAGLKLKGPDAVSVILMSGLQGSGKTTTSAKLALRLKKAGRKPLLAACDLARPAASEQLAVLGSQIDVPVYREDAAAVNGDAVLVFKGAFRKAQETGCDVIIADSAGRIELDDAMMSELVRLRDAAKPDETLFVADSMTGQSAATTAKVFDEKIGVSGVILTKFDSDARGGAALSLKTVTGKPLKFVGTGEKPSDFEVFHPQRFAGRILGMGDIVSLVEKAQETVSQKEALELQKKMEKETFTLEDYLEQLRSVKKMGSMKSLLEMVPGLSGKVSEEDIENAETRLHEIIISSMTKKERANHLIIGPSRRSRIARGSGTSVADVSRLIKRFDKMKTMMKKMAKMGKNPAAMRQMLGAV
ncbi:MAG: signal recognition particle protein [Spirochaetaceae bacterium]|jgi:signal recognition particle subunit SRP54|nr:signal recognition particle protein [Spirochaetaceae bacterium]